jgi:hypothetical protein
MGASSTYFFVISHSSGRVFSLENMALSSSHGSNFTKDSYNFSSSSDEDMI